MKISADEANLMRRRYALTAHVLVEQLGPVASQIEGPEAANALALLDSQLANLRQAFKQGLAAKPRPYRALPELITQRQCPSGKGCRHAEHETCRSSHNIPALRAV